MAYDQDFLELIADADEAIVALLGESTEDSWIDVRAGLRELRQAVRAEQYARKLKKIKNDLANSREERTHQGSKSSRFADDRKEAEALWQQMPRERREALLFQALGDERSVIRELTDRMNRELGYPRVEGAYRVRALYGNEVGSLVKRLWRSGQLDRDAEIFNVNHMRYRYFRKRRLDGAIADLERAYNATSDDPGCMT